MLFFGGGGGNGVKIENEKIKVSQLMSSRAPCCESGLSGIVHLFIIIPFIFSFSTTPNPIFSNFPKLSTFPPFFYYKHSINHPKILKHLLNNSSDDYDPIESVFLE